MLGSGFGLGWATSEDRAEAGACAMTLTKKWVKLQKMS